MKILYILGALMFIGIFMIFICSLKVLNEMSVVQRTTFRRPLGLRPQKPQPTTVKPSTMPFVVGTYLGLTFFVVGAVGSIIVLVQVSMRRF